LVSYIIKQLDKNKIKYPEQSSKIELTPTEVYTYTRNKELIEREKEQKTDDAPAEETGSD